MGRNDMCFCGSQKKYKQCHLHINESSIIARLYRLYTELDNHIERKKIENSLEFNCTKGCSECCSHCFYVSESELVLILDYLKSNWSKADIEYVINTAKRQWSIILRDDPLFAKQLQVDITGKDLNFYIKRLYSSPSKLPFSCLFLDENTKACSIYDVRPLVCRIHGLSYVDGNDDNSICSNIPSLLKVKDKLVNLEAYNSSIASFTVLMEGKKVLLRRPQPLFYFINSIFENVSNVEEYIETVMYNRATLYSEVDYIRDLFYTYAAR
jgi:Fe-S-cluster containining protein